MLCPSLIPKRNLMKPRNFIALVAVVSAFILPYVIPASQSDQAQSQSPTMSGSKQAPYHQSDMSKRENSYSSSKTKAVEPVAAHASYPKSALTNIEVLPSSISLVGPRYEQRVVVEGTFADGHQEDLTSQAKLASSDEKVAALDNGDLLCPQGDGHTSL